MYITSQFKGKVSYEVAADHMNSFSDTMHTLEQISQEISWDDNVYREIISAQYCFCSIPALQAHLSFETWMSLACALDLTDADILCENCDSCRKQSFIWRDVKYYCLVSRKECSFYGLGSF